MMQMDNAVIQIRMATALKQIMDAMASVNQERQERALPQVCGQLAKEFRCQLLS